MTLATYIETTIRILEAGNGKRAHVRQDEGGWTVYLHHINEGAPHRTDYHLDEHEAMKAALAFFNEPEICPRCRQALPPPQQHSAVPG